MAVIDSHLHVWNAESAATPWSRDWAPFAHLPSFMPERALEEMDAAGVDRALLIPTPWDMTGSELMLHAALNAPARFGVMGHVSVRHPDADLIVGMRERRILGFRLVYPPGSTRPWLRDGSADWFWQTVEAADVPVMVWMPGESASLELILERFPLLRIAIDHLNLGMKTSEEDLKRAGESLRRFARYRNVALKVSALPAASHERYPFGDVQGVVREVIDMFGSSRVFWGSDVTRMPCPYDQCLGVLRDSSLLTEREKELVLGAALQEWLPWRILPTAEGMKSSSAIRESPGGES